MNELSLFSRAKLLLRKKRYQEQLLERTDKQLENLEKMAHDIEFAQIELTVVEGLKVGNDALKKVNDAMNIEDIERILEETREGVEKQQVIYILLVTVIMYYCIVKINNMNHDSKIAAGLLHNAS